jgi:hypothetical protein
MICKLCRAHIEYYIVRQIEEHYYKYYPETNQLEDFHGDESLVESEYTCPACEAEIDL